MVPLLIAPDVINRLQDRLPDSYAVAVVSLVAPILCVWCFVELFCLRGRAGLTDTVLIPSPLAIRGRAGTSKAALEFVPHRAGPSPAPYVKRGP